MTVGRNEVTPPYKITFRIIFIIVRTLTWGETMETITFTADLERNIRMMQELFRNDDTLIIRRAIGQNGLRCVLFFFDGMVNSLAINQSLVRPILRCEQPRLSADILAAAVLQADECRVETDMNKVFAAFLYGDAIVLTDGDARPVLVNTKGFDKRSTAEPENERVLSGPREGFTECFMPNLALIRRRVNDPRLKFRFMRVGSRTNTNVCLCYIAGLCENSLVERLETRLTALDIDSVLDSNYLAERIRDHRWSPFPTLGTTERPDVAASRMLEGRCVIVVDGSPVALTAPFLFQECFQSNDDYYISFLQANLSRILRVIGFVFTITFPAMYAALMLYHRELVPARLLFAVSAAQRGVPLPIGWEILLMLFVLEALKEAGARTPGAMGQTMSIVGGLVLGDAAVSARFAAAPTVIVVAIAGVTGLMVPKLQTAALWLRFVLLAAAASWGLYGVGLALGLTLAALLGTVPAQSGAAHLCRARGHLASLSMVFHALRPLCRQTPVEGGTPVKLLRFLPLLLLLCGCAREVSPVSALALDCKNGVYCLTAEVVRQDSPDDTAAPAYLSATGTDVTDALRNLRSILPGDLYLSHAQVLLLSEDAVSESILPLADYLCRENDVRLSLRAAVVRDGSAAELLENDNEVYALSELLDRSAQDGILPDMPLYRVTDVLHADGTAILPALRVDAFGQTAPAGTAVFKNERLNCFLDGEIGGGAYA